MSVPKGPSLFSSPTPTPALGLDRRILEFQAVVLAGGDSALLYPLLEDKQCLGLLSVANRPLLYYQLRLLEKAGFSQCIVAVEETHRKAIHDYLGKASFKIKVELFHPKLAADGWESGVVLKQLAPMIFTDFIVVAGDLVSEASIQELADVHRSRDATATMLLKENEPVDWKELKSTAPTFSYTAVQAEESRTFFGLQQSGQHTTDHRVVMVRGSEGDDGPCLIGRNMLSRCPRFVLHTNLTDAHLYIFKRWVLDLLEMNENFASVKDDLLPYLVAIQHRRDFAAEHPEVWAKAKSTQSLAQTMSSAAWSAPSDEDRVRVYSFVTPYKKGGSVFIARANSLEAYGWMSFAILDHAVGEMTPWDQFQSSQPTFSADDTHSEIASMRSGSERSARLIRTLLGTNSVVHPSANVKRCIIGDNCHIGPKVKMGNCLVLQGVRIEEGAELENCLLASGAIVRKGVQLKKCQVGPRYIVDVSAENTELTSRAEDNLDVNDEV
jgi:translation initiation factor eIF-2B subunit gamma